MICLSTNLPGFFNDMADVIRLFKGTENVCAAAEIPENADLYRHEETVCGYTYTHTASHAGQTVCLSREFVNLDDLALKRARKRLSKAVLYNLLKSQTGATPPWGSLTGIRPTRLYYEGRELGLSHQQALDRLSSEFDVSAGRVSLIGDIVEMQKGVLYPPTGSFDLYIGIPFCRTRCSYCSFSAGELGNGKLVEPYVSALVREIELCAQLMNEHGLKPRAAYIGGGTPSAIPAPALEKVLAAAQEKFPGAVEWTVECGRPDSISPDILSMLRRHNVDRICVNPQTFCDETLRAVGRDHTSADILRAFHLARDMGFGHINMDLIAGLPGETLDIFTHSLESVIALNPESVTVHALAIKHSSRLHEQMVKDRLDHPSLAGEAGRMITFARETLNDGGWHPYYLYRQKYMADNLENVGYAKKGHACLYNIGNMEETASVLALGAGAVSKWLFDRARRIERAPNVKNIQEYIARVDEMVARKRALISPGGEKA